MAREIQVARDLCMGSGQCAFYAPNTFALEEETAIAVVVNPTGGDPDDAIETAIKCCPSRAISIVNG